MEYDHIFRTVLLVAYGVMDKNVRGISSLHLPCSLLAGFCLGPCILTEFVFFTITVSMSKRMTQCHWWLVNVNCLFLGFHPEEKPKHSFPWAIRMTFCRFEMASKGRDWTKDRGNVIKCCPAGCVILGGLLTFLGFSFCI